MKSKPKENSNKNKNSNSKLFIKEMFVFNAVCNLVVAPISFVIYILTGGYGNTLFFIFLSINILLIMADFFIGRFYNKKSYKTILIYFLLLTVVGLVLCIFDYLAQTVIPPSILTNYAQLTYSALDISSLPLAIQNFSANTSQMLDNILTLCAPIIVENIFKLIAFLLGNRARKNDNGKK